MPSARTPSDSGRIAALSTQGRSGFSDSSRKTTPPCLGPRQTRIDAIKCPTLAVAPIVDDEIAVLETELVQIVAVESGLSDSIDPGHDARKISKLCAARLAASRSWPARHDRGGAGGRRGRRDRPVVGAGEHSEAAVRFNPNRHFRADKIETLSPQLSRSANSDPKGRLRLSARLRRSCRQHRARRCRASEATCGPAHRVRVWVPPTLDTVIAAEIFLDRCLQPRRRKIKLDRSAGEPPPQAKARPWLRMPRRSQTPEQTPQETRANQLSAPRRNPFHVASEQSAACRGDAAGRPTATAWARCPCSCSVPVMRLMAPLV